jgi:hypothetical protein
VAQERGVLVVVLTGIRRIFGSHENWQRFIDASLALASERALYVHGFTPYADAGSRDERLLRRSGRSRPRRGPAGGR